MRETRTSGSMRGIVETEPMVQLLRHRQTKEAATDMLDLPALRHIPTLPPFDLRHGGLRLRLIGLSQKVAIDCY